MARARARVFAPLDRLTTAFSIAPGRFADRYPPHTKTRDFLRVGGQRSTRRDVTEIDPPPGGLSTWASALEWQLTHSDRKFSSLLSPPARRGIKWCTWVAGTTRPYSIIAHRSVDDSRRWKTRLRFGASFKQHPETIGARRLAAHDPPQGAAVTLVEEGAVLPQANSPASRASWPLDGDGLQNASWLASRQPVLRVIDHGGLLQAVRVAGALNRHRNAVRRRDALNRRRNGSRENMRNLPESRSNSLD